MMRFTVRYLYSIVRQSFTELFATGVPPAGEGLEAEKYQGRQYIVFFNLAGNRVCLVCHLPSEWESALVNTSPSPQSAPSCSTMSSGSDCSDSVLRERTSDLSGTPFRLSVAPGRSRQLVWTYPRCSRSTSKNVICRRSILVGRDFSLFRGWPASVFGTTSGSQAIQPFTQQNLYSHSEGHSRL